MKKQRVSGAARMVPEGANLPEHHIRKRADYSTEMEKNQMTIEREIINERIRELVPLAGIGRSREAQEELDRLICIDAEYAREEPKEDESGWITIYRAGWSEERTRAVIERSNAMIAAAMA